jgi:7,8-dihydroneopterin aldolase/epimerase/oxygenase
MGQLILENMEFYAYHGHYDEEQTIGGKFIVDLIIDTDLSKPAETDQLEDAIDYSKIYQAVRHEMGKPSRLLEHLAMRIIKAVYASSEGIASVRVTVSKLNPAIGGHMSRFSVVLTR